MDEERYEITQLLGKADSSSVYVATDHHRGHRVVIRRFSHSIHAPTDAEWGKHFIAFTQVLENTRGAHLPTLLDAGVDNDGAYLITQMIEGEFLLDVIPEKALNEAEAQQLARQLLSALDCAHTHGIIHGALNPDSILCTQQRDGSSRYYLVDLGVSKLTEIVTSAPTKTQACFRAPELLTGRPATVQSDLYALGQILYYALAGGHPFALLSEKEHIIQLSKLPPLSDFSPGLSNPFAQWISSLLNLEPSKRPPSAKAALDTLNLLKLNPRPPRRLAGFVAATLLLTAAGLTLTWTLRTHLANTPDSLASTPPTLHVPPPIIPPPPTHLTTSQNPLTQAHILHSNAVDENHPTTGNFLSETNTLDWVVCSAPLSHWQQHRHSQGKIIHSLQPLGHAAPLSRPIGNLHFSNAEAHFAPDLCASTQAAGDGWRLTLHPSQEPLLLRIYCSAWEGNAILQLFGSDKETPLISPLLCHSNKKNYSFCIQLQLTSEQLQNNTSLYLDLTSTEATRALSLSALIIEPSPQLDTP